jgi:hypothetical protein
VFKNSTWRVFLIGGLCGSIFTGLAGASLIWWKARDGRSAADQAIYDTCLTQQGNTVACDAFMRVLDRERAAEKEMKKEAAQVLAAGHSKQEVANWAFKHGFVGSQVSEVVGISLQDLQADRY